MADVLIIGAGIIGSSIAIELLSRGDRVTLLERSVPGAESSSAAAGMLAPQVEAHAPDAGFQLGLYSRGLYADWCGQLEEATGIHVAHQRDGGLSIFSDEAELSQAAAELDWQLQAGLHLERVGEKELAALAPGLRPGLAGGVYFPDEAQVDPRALMRALSFRCHQLGAQYRTGQRVERIVAAQDRARGVLLDGELIEAEQVIVAAGAWSTRIPGTGLPEHAIEPARGQMLALALGTPPFLPFLSTKGAYLVPRRDGRVLIGATVERVGFDKAVTAGALSALLQAALGVAPALSAAPVIETWAGLRPATADGAPLLGRAPLDGLFLATGHYRNGILQAPATARIVSALVHGEAPPIEIGAFDPNRFSGR